MSVLIVIPARYASQRFPGKPLASLRGASGIAKSLIERSWLAASAADLDAKIIVATEDQQILDTVAGFGGEAVMTSSACRNGTERCAEVVEVFASKGATFDIVVNLQGDAPLTPSWFVEELVKALREEADQVAMATPVLRCDAVTLQHFRQDRAEGRVGGTTAVFDAKWNALYFSKEVIPFAPISASPIPVFHHVGLYAYRPDALRAYAQAKPGLLEQNEGLEQLRFLEMGQRIRCVEVEAKGRAFWELNNPEDVARIEGMLRDMALD